jgi:hypothetical protein
MEWKTKHEVKSSFGSQSKIKQKTYGSKHFVINSLRWEVDKEYKDTMSLWEALSELVRIIEQVKIEKEAVSGMR